MLVLILCISIQLRGIFKEFPDISISTFPNKITVEAKHHHEVKKVNNQKLINFILEDFKQLNRTQDTVQDELIFNAALKINGILNLFYIRQNHL